MKRHKVVTRKVDPKVLARVQARRAATGSAAMQGAMTVRAYTADRPMSGREFKATRAAV